MQFVNIIIITKSKINLSGVGNKQILAIPFLRPFGFFPLKNFF
jgi:hypothetical protein